MIVFAVSVAACRALGFTEICRMKQADLKAVSSTFTVPIKRFVPSVNLILRSHKISYI